MFLESSESGRCHSAMDRGAGEEQLIMLFDARFRNSSIIEVNSNQ
jgi:hypothetical protein